MQSKDSIPLAEAAAKRPLQLTPNLGAAHAALAWARAARWDWAGAEQEFKQAIELDPDEANSHYFYTYEVLGPQLRHEEAIREIRRALELEPASLVINGNYGGALTAAHRYAEAKEQLVRAIAMTPSFPLSRTRMREWDEIQGDFDDARQQMIAPNPEFSKMTAHPGKEGYWRAMLEWNRQQIQLSGEDFFKRILTADG
jgi:tetratricopeptide (TPR) repeat protein